MKNANGVLAAVVACVALGCMSNSVGAQSTKNGPVLGGTVNVILANKNGAVVLTDSMLSDESGPLPVPHPEIPGQKLFQIDDKTVCAIAGFVSAPGIFPEFSPSVQAIVTSFSAELKQKPPQTFTVKLTALAMLMGQNITAIGALRASANRPLSAKNYLSTVTLVGYDLDGVLKIGQAQLGTDPAGIRSGATISSFEVVPVTDEFMFRLAGKWGTAQALLENPASQPDDPALAKYVASRAADGGASLTLPEMRDLACSLASYTHSVEPTVGGDDQVAEIENGNASIVEQKSFPTAQKTLVHFNLFYNFSVLMPGSNATNDPGAAFFKRSSPVAMPKGSSGIYVESHFANVQQPLDNQYYSLTTFEDCVVFYDGGPFYFDRNNKVARSYLLLGPNVDRQDPAVQSLISEHEWLP